jgi:hypothetical protein
VVVLDTAYPVASARRGVAKFTDGLLIDELRQLIEFVKRNSVDIEHSRRHSHGVRQENTRLGIGFEPAGHKPTVERHAGGIEWYDQLPASA